MNIIFKGSPNKDTNRSPIDRIVIHWFGEGTLDSANSRFQNPTSKVSAHYGISGDLVYQWVKEEEVAYHSGDYGMNQRSIGIEHDATTDHNASESTYKTSIELIKIICKKYSIPIDRTHIIKHSEVKPTQCPGTIDLDRIIREVSEEQVPVSQLSGRCRTTIIDSDLKVIRWPDVVEYNPEKKWTYEDLDKFARSLFERATKGEANAIKFSEEYSKAEKSRIEAESAVAERIKDIETLKTRLTEIEKPLNDSILKLNGQIKDLNEDLENAKIDLEQANTKIETLTEEVKLNEQGIKDKYSGWDWLGYGLMKILKGGGKK